MERKIGEVFEYEGKWYRVEAGTGCRGCAFKDTPCPDIKNILGECGYYTDGVIFAEAPPPKPTIETPIDYNPGDYTTLEIDGCTVVTDEDCYIYAILSTDHISGKMVDAVQRELEQRQDEAEEERRRSGMGWAKGGKNK